MKTTIDKAGRLVIPKELRDRVGMTAGEVVIEVDGAGLRVAPIAQDALVTHRGRLLVPAVGADLSDDDVHALRDADQR